MFVKLVISYLIILFIPIVIASFAYREVVRIVEEDAEKANINTLLQTRDIMDIRLKEIQSVAKQLAIHPAVNNLLNHAPFGQGDKDFFQVYAAYNQLPKFTLTNRFISDYYVYLPKSGIVIASEGVFASPEDLRRFAFPGWDESSFREMLTGNPASPSFIPMSGPSGTGASEGLLFLQTLPIDAVRAGGGTVAIGIDGGQIRELLGKTEIGREGIAYILDDRNRLVTYIAGDRADPSLLGESGPRAEPDPRSEAGGSYIVSRAYSEDTHWTYVSVVPARSVLGKVYYIKEMTISIFIGIVLAGLLISLFLAHRNAKPLTALMQRFRSLFHADFAPEDGADEFDSLTRTMMKISKDREKLVREREDYRPLMVSMLFRRLLEGEIAQEEEVRRELDRLEVRMEPGGALSMLFSIERYHYLVYEDVLQETDAVQMVVKEMFRQGVPEANRYIYDLDPGRVAFIFAGERVHDASFRHALRSTAQVLSGHHGGKFRLNFSLGGSYPELARLHESFREAKSALEFGGYSDKSWIEYADLPEQDEEFLFPVELETRLLRTIKAGDIPAVKELTDLIRRENFANRTLTASRLEQLIQVVKGSLSRGLGAYPNESIGRTLREVNEAQQFEEIVHGIHALCAVFYHLSQKKKYEERNAASAKLRAYLEERYPSADLTIGQAARDFGMSESSFYLFFKEHMGATFASMLEEIRIARAIEILNGDGGGAGEVTVRAIAGSVGYANEHTFRRAFKRVTGHVPTKFKAADRGPAE